MPCVDDQREISGGTPELLAAQYVRMSTEHQQYSTENQAEVIAAYAKTHGMRIVRTYADEGKSGLNIAGRDALRRLIADVESGNVDFSVILVYDVSRWGRFQDADESAYYEYLCKRANIRVHYCAEPFANDGSLSASILKTIKRTMAGEYSRELSVKVFTGQCRLVELGFHQGGMAGYGLRRLLRDQHGNPKGLLAKGDRKSLQTDRVILVPGPPEEIAIIEEIYNRFVHARQIEREIANDLNVRGIPAESGLPWTRAIVHQILTNHKYIGVNVYNRTSFKLKKKHVKNPPEMWIRREDAYTPIIARALFEQAQAVIAARHATYSDDDMLRLLKELLARAGKLSGILIDETEGLPSSAAYQHRFKSLLRAYTLIGYQPDHDYSYLAINRALRIRHQEHVASILATLNETGASVTQDPTTGVLRINDEFTASLILARCRHTSAGGLRWLLRLEHALNPDITIAARLAPDNQTILDYYLLPDLDRLWTQLRLAPENGMVLDVYRFADLTFFCSLARRTLIEEAA